MVDALDDTAAAALEARGRARAGLARSGEDHGGDPACNLDRLPLFEPGTVQTLRSRIHSGNVQAAQARAQAQQRQQAAQDQQTAQNDIATLQQDARNLSGDLGSLASDVKTSNRTWIMTFSRTWTTTPSRAWPATCSRG